MRLIINVAQVFKNFSWKLQNAPGRHEFQSNFLLRLDF